MAKTIEEMAAIGKGKLTRKESRMKSRWEGRVPGMKASFGALPFGPTIKAAYNEGIDAALTAKAYRVDADKWAEKWAAKMKL